SAGSRGGRLLGCYDDIVGRIVRIHCRVNSVENSGSQFVIHCMKTRKLHFVLPTLLFALLSISAVSVDRLKAHVTWLADPAREGRHAGTPGAAAASEYISAQLKELGCDVQMQDFGGRRRNVV